MPTRKKSPEIIEFPKPPKGINLMTPDEFLNSQPADTDIPHPDPETGRLIHFPATDSTPELHMRQNEPCHIATCPSCRNLIAHWIARSLYKVAEWPIDAMRLSGEVDIEFMVRSWLEEDA